MDDIEKKARELRAKYMRDWRSKNPDKKREQNRKYWIRKAEKAAEEEKSDE